jgi:hypothetical protein
LKICCDPYEVADRVHILRRELYETLEVDVANCEPCGVEYVELTKWEKEGDEGDTTATTM